jgi:hypothetical protein
VTPPWTVLQGRVFPPVLVALTPPPNVLIISPRTSLRVVQSVLLKSDLDDAEVNGLEASADSTGMSSLVSPIGGIATYPAIVLDSEPPDFVISSAAHEWVHQYLIFYPLGQRYWTSQKTREINETVADLVGREIGGQVYQALGRPTQPPAPPSPPVTPGFDFRAFMRATRLRVEGLLAAGQVDDAEAYMRARRDELAANGYVIRRLNQAYFAFNGSYGESAAASPRSPLPRLVRQLRDQSSDVGAFLARVRTITTLAGLTQAVSSAP